MTQLQAQLVTLTHLPVTTLAGSVAAARQPHPHQLHRQIGDSQLLMLHRRLPVLIPAVAEEEHPPPPLLVQPPRLRLMRLMFRRPQRAGKVMMLMRPHQCMCGAQTSAYKM